MGCVGCNFQFLSNWYFQGSYRHPSTIFQDQMCKRHYFSGSFCWKTLFFMSKGLKDIVFQDQFFTHFWKKIIYQDFSGLFRTFQDHVEKPIIFQDFSGQYKPWFCLYISCSFVLITFLKNPYFIFINNNKGLQLTGWLIVDIETWLI